MEIALIVVNVITGAVGAYVLARRFRAFDAGKGNAHRQYGILISVSLFPSFRSFHPQ